MSSFLSNLSTRALSLIHMGADHEQATQGSSPVSQQATQASSQESKYVEIFTYGTIPLKEFKSGERPTLAIELPMCHQPKCTISGYKAGFYSVTDEGHGGAQLTVIKTGNPSDTVRGVLLKLPKTDLDELEQELNPFYNRKISVLVKLSNSEPAVQKSAFCFIATERCLFKNPNGSVVDFLPRWDDLLKHELLNSCPLVDQVIDAGGYKRPWTRDKLAARLKLLSSEELLRYKEYSELAHQFRLTRANPDGKITHGQRYSKPLSHYPEPGKKDHEYGDEGHQICFVCNPDERINSLFRDAQLEISLEAAEKAWAAREIRQSSRVGQSSRRELEKEVRSLEQSYYFLTEEEGSEPQVPWNAAAAALYRLNRYNAEKLTPDKRQEVIDAYRSAKTELSRLDAMDKRLAARKPMDEGQ